MHVPRLSHRRRTPCLGSSARPHRGHRRVILCVALGWLLSGGAQAQTGAKAAEEARELQSLSVLQNESAPPSPDFSSGEPFAEQGGVDAGGRFSHRDDLRVALRTGPVFRDFDAHAKTRRLQILISEVQRGDAALRMDTRGYRVDAEYLYPASALKHLAAYALFGAQPGLSDAQRVRPSDTLRFYARPPAGLREEALTEYRGASQKIRVDDLVRRTLITSSNEGYNRLYDAMGHTGINQWLAGAGFVSPRLRHRLYAFEDPVQHLLSPRVDFERDGDVYRVKPAQQDVAWPQPNIGAGQQIGARHRDEQASVLIEAPMDFSQKNAVTLSDLHRSILALMAPELVPDISLDLQPAARAFLIEVMSEFPSGKADRGFEQRVDRYKPLLPGVRTALGDGAVRYVNKAGRAYGFHLDTAWIENTQNGRAVVVTVGTYVNANETLNDDRYEYRDSYALMKELGAWIAEHYLK